MGFISDAANAMTLGMFKGSDGQNYASQSELDRANEKKAFDEKYALKYNPITEGADGKIALRDEFKQKAPDEYVNKLLEKQNLSEQNSRDNTAAQGQGALQNAFSSLSSRGGLNSANRAGLARSNMRDTLLNQQTVARQGMTDRNAIGIQGAQMNKQTDDANVAALGSAATNVNNFNLEKYKQEMNVKASNNMADATRAAAPKPKGGLFG